MIEKVLNRYKLTIKDGYINGFCAVEDGDYDYYGQMADFPEACDGWTKFENGEFIIDENKKAEILEQRRIEAEKPTQLDIIEAQITYTALMTDTLLEA